jgi:hypothetical protein
MKLMGSSMFEREPELELDDTMLKAVKDWDVGENYTLTLKVKMREKELCEDGSIEGCFTILKVTAE